MFANWNRHYPVLSIVKNEHPFEIFPLHLAQPWDCLKDLDLHSLQTFMYILNRNPAYIQLKNLLKSNVTTNTKQIFFGDFNIPRPDRHFFSIHSSSNRLFEGYGYTNIFSELPKGVFSWPSPSSSNKKQRKLTIDQGFISQDLSIQFSSIFPWQGADHFPIYLEINTP